MSSSKRLSCMTLLTTVAYTLMAASAHAADPTLPPEEATKSILDQATVKDPTSDSNLTKIQKRAERSINYYKPIYLAYGQPATKLQFSFRSQLSEVIPLNFAYSQIIFWELETKSKPFLDATYNPEFFYRWQPKGEKWNAVDIGLWEHNSNGKRGAASRSYDQSYIRAVYAKGWREWALLFSPKIRYIYGEDEGTRDIDKYVGPLDLDIHLVDLVDKFMEQMEVIFTLTPGGKYAEQWDQGGYQVALNFKVKALKMNPLLYVQYYHGYAETLINYNERIDQFRIGLMF